MTYPIADVFIWLRPWAYNSRSFTCHMKVRVLGICWIQNWHNPNYIFSNTTAWTHNLFIRNCVFLDLTLCMRRIYLFMWYFQMFHTTLLFLHISIPKSFLGILYSSLKAFSHLISKHNNKTQWWAGEMIQCIMCLPCKHKKTCSKSQKLCKKSCMTV